MSLPDVHSRDDRVFVTLQPRSVRIRSSDTIFLKDSGVAEVFQFDANLPFRVVTVSRFVFVDEIETSDWIQIARLLIETLELWYNLLRVFPVLRDRFSFHVDHVVVVLVVIPRPCDVLRHFVRGYEFYER